MTIHADRMRGYQYRAFLDGKEIKLTYYTDRRRGRLRTFDILGDGRFYPVERFTELTGIPIDPSWHAPKGGVFWQELRGMVTLERLNTPADAARRRREHAALISTYGKIRKPYEWKHR